MAKSRNVSERERFSIKCLTDWMLMTAVFDPALLETPAVVLPEPDEKQIKEFAYLTDRGCDTVMLYASLLNVERLHKALPKISPRDLESLASSLESDLRRMVNLVKSHAHPIFVEGAEENDRRMRKTSGDGVRLTIKLKDGSHKGEVPFVLEGTAGSLHVTQRLKEDLEEKIGAYRELAQMARDGIVPRSDRLRHLCKLLPVRYVERRTGRGHFAKVQRLLDWASGESLALSTRFGPF